MRLRSLAAALVAALAALAPVAVPAAGPAAAAPGQPAPAADLFLSEYVEGTGFTKAVEVANATGAAVDLAGGGYTLELYSNGAPTASQSVGLQGTVADGDVVVVSRADADPAVVALADQLAPAVVNWNGDDAVVLRRGGEVLDVIGQVGVDPGTEWGTGLTSTADNTLRRKAGVVAGDTDPTNAFDPSAEWDGFAVDTVDGLGAHTVDGGGNAPVAIACGTPLATTAGTAASREVTASDADGTVVDVAVTGVTPAPEAGSIERTALTPATAVGGVATATVTVSAEVPVGTYAVALTATNDDGVAQVASCTLSVAVQGVRPIGEVQGPVTGATAGATYQSPLVGQQVVVRGVVTQETLALSSSGNEQNGFFLQDRPEAADGDVTTSDGVFVFLGGFSTLLRADGGPAHDPAVGEELTLRATVTEYFNLTQLTSPRLVEVGATGLDPDSDVAVTTADPPDALADAERYWERHEGERIRVPAGSVAISGRAVFGSTADSEAWVVRGDEPIATRDDPYARRVFRDPHPLDNLADQAFDDGNGARILLAGLGVKGATGDASALLPPVRTFDVLEGDAVGGLSFSFEKYGVQVESAAFTPGADPAANAAPSPAARDREVAVSTYNLENLYDFRDDPTDGCDFATNAGCPGVNPPFDYVPESAAAYEARLGAMATQVTEDLHSPDILLTQEAEDQDICAVTGGALACGGPEAGDGKPDTLQELALAIAAAGGGTYDAALDRDGADDRGIVAGFLYRTDRVALAPVAAGDPVLGATPGVEYRAPGLPTNADVSNPKALNAELPADVDTSTGRDGDAVFTRAPQVARFRVQAAPGSGDTFDVWAISNHWSSTPDARVGQRTEQAAYGAAIATAVEAGFPGARVVLGGDLNVYPRPDDPFAPGHPLFPSDQLGPLYDAGLANLWDDLVAEVPASAYSYVFEGQAQTLDQLFVNEALHADLVRVRAAHVNADWPADHPDDGARGLSDHDPQVARFATRAGVSVGDAQVTEGDRGTTPARFTVSLTRPRAQATQVCLVPFGITASVPGDADLALPCGRIAAGATSAELAIPVRGDRRDERDEAFGVLAVPGPGTRPVDLAGRGTIVDDD